MGDPEDSDMFLKYAELCERSATTADEAEKELWLRMAAAWRRKLVPPPEAS